MSFDSSHQEDLGKQDRFDTFSRFVMLPVLLAIPLFILIAACGLIAVYFNSDQSSLIRALELGNTLLMVCAFILGSGLAVFCLIWLFAWATSLIGRVRR